MKDKADIFSSEGHRKRIREKYISGGCAGWHDYELLELLLTYAIPRRDIKPIAKSLVEKFGSLNGVLDAEASELKSIKGIGENCIALLSIIKDIQKIYLQKRLDDKALVTSPKSACDYLMAELKGEKNEKIVVLFLNKGNRPVHTETVQEGTVDRAPLYPRKVVEKALKHHSTAIIVAHNHPGGSLRPSEDDKNITRLLQEALSPLDIKLLDHIIISEKGYFSFREEGLL
ncbi:MAG: DNA repair protein RadC [Candidatus Schekmanbacteria bacterium]|nr:DNA repair protein RadC [Candidatus Schekmanbacteria bacterium]